MPPVDPIDGPDNARPPYGVAHNPFLYELLAAKAQRAGHPVTASDPATPAMSEHAPRVDDPDTPDVDEGRLSSDRQYLFATLDKILWRAREYFRAGHYQSAEEQYIRFFRYQHFYGNRFQGIQDNYYFALFERSWLLEIIGKQQEAERFLNEQLMRKFEWALAHPEGDRHADDLERIINGMVTRGELPNPHYAQSLYKHIATRTLSNLMQQLINTQHTQLAHNVLAHIEVRQLLSLFHTEREAQRLFPQQQQGLLSPLLQAALLQQAAAQRGLPMAPVLPALPKSSHELPDIEHVYTDLVEPVYGLGKDPNEAANLKNRQKKAAEKRRRQITRKRPPGGKQPQEE